MERYYVHQLDTGDMNAVPYPVSEDAARADDGVTYLSGKKREKALTEMGLSVEDFSAGEIVSDEIMVERGKFKGMSTRAAAQARAKETDAAFAPRPRGQNRPDAA